MHITHAWWLLYIVFLLLSILSSKLRRYFANEMLQIEMS